MLIIYYNPISMNHKISSRFILLSTTIILLLLSKKSLAQDEKPSIFDIETKVTLTIKADISGLISNNYTDENFTTAQVNFEINGENILFDARINTRGHFRRDTLNCDFPPLKLKFKKDNIKKTILVGNTTVKIVTHCKSKVPEFKQFIMREYMTYKIYNIITPYSLQVKVVDIIYEDFEGKEKPIKKTAFLIEDIDHLAKRNGMKEYEEFVSYDDINSENANQLSIYQFMIGNSDWIVPMAKNIKFISDENNIIAIPYDFDYTAIVGTDYSLGRESTFLSSPDRMYIGACCTVQDLENYIPSFNDKKKDIMKLISSSKVLDYESKQHMKVYLNEFYRIINSDSMLAAALQANCEN